MDFLIYIQKKNKKKFFEYNLKENFFLHKLHLIIKKGNFM